MGSRPNQAQLEALVGFLEQNPEIAKGLLRTQQGKTETKRKWNEVASMINALGGVQKNGPGWSKYWAEKKCALKKVCAQQAKSIRRTGGGTESVPSLSGLDQRFIAVMGGHSFATGNSEVAVDPFPHMSQSNAPPPPTLIELNLPSTSQGDVEVAGVESMDVHTDNLPNTVPPVAPQNSSQRRTRGSQNMRSQLDITVERLTQIEERRVEAELQRAQALAEAAMAFNSVTGGLNNIANAIREVVIVIQEATRLYFSR